MIHTLHKIASTRPPAAVSPETVRIFTTFARCGTVFWVSKAVAQKVQSYRQSIDTPIESELPCELPPFIQRRTDTILEGIREKRATERRIRKRLFERRAEDSRERIGSALLFDAYC